jgi:hypothetical protein
MGLKKNRKMKMEGKNKFVLMFAAFNVARNTWSRTQIFDVCSEVGSVTRRHIS